MSHEHATSLSESNALSLARPTTDSARGLNRALLRVWGRNVVARVASRASTLSATHALTRAHHTSSYVLCRERADTCVVALKVGRTVAHAAGHRQRTAE